MKISAYWKEQGATVTLNGSPGDRNYLSVIYLKNKPRARQIVMDYKDKEVHINYGGSGTELWERVLPFEVEHLYRPDYDLYGWKDYSMVFTSRGCIRKCPFCIVSKKEGSIRAWDTVAQAWDKKHNKIMLLDNNILAAPNWRETFTFLIDYRKELKVIENGMDIRLINERNCDSTLPLTGLEWKKL